MNKKKIETFRQMLIKERERILKSNLSNDALEQLGVNDSGDIVDVASKLYETDFFLQIADYDKETLDMINRALEKIDAGTYGICEGSGKPIEESRLNAIPWTPFSLEYAQKIPKKKFIRETPNGF